MSTQADDTAQIFNKLEEYMFTRGNMAKYNKVFSTMIIEKIKEEKSNKHAEMPAPVSAPAPVIVKKKETHFTPVQKDKLFWSFYIILKGVDDYELSQPGHFAIEKNFKISTVEKLRSLKNELKEAKLKLNELEDELVNKEMITLKGLHALCLVHKVSITYIYSRMYCEFLYGAVSTDPNVYGASADTSATGVIIKMGVNDNSVKYDADEEYMKSVRDNFWKIENTQKPLGSAGTYSLKDLQDICNKLEIPITNETGKNKLKTALYEDIMKMI